MGIGILVTIAMARYLGPTNFGILNYVTAYVGLFSTTVLLGLNEIVILELVKSPQLLFNLKGTVFLLIFFSSILSFIFLGASFFFNGNDVKTNTYIFVVSISMFFQPFYVIEYYFQAHVQSKYAVTYQFITLIIISLSKMIFIYFNASLFYFVLLTLFETTLIAAGLLLSYYRNTSFKIFQWKFEYALAKKLLKQSWPIILSGISIAVYMRIDQIMIKNILGFNALGNFSVAVRLTELWYFIPMSIGASFFPALISAKNQGDIIYRQRFLKLMSLMVCISLCIAIFMFFFSKFIILNLYGSSYLGAINVFNIYIWASIFVFLGVISSKWYIIEDLNHISFIRSLFGAIINICLNFVLIPNFGINGAAFSTLISYSIQVYFSNFFFKKTRNLFYMQSSVLFLIYPIKYLLNSFKNNNI